MSYTHSQISQIELELPEALSRLHELSFDYIRVGQHFEPVLQEHLIRGFCRRIDVIRNTVQNIFLHFPPGTTQKLSIDALSNVQINLQAFLINVFGALDNLAWAFILRHDLESAFKRNAQIGLFQDETQKFLPDELRTYLNEARIQNWFERHLKNNRDALAHRIPLYVPPFVVVGDDRTRFNKLEQEKSCHLQNGDFQSYERALSEQESLGKPCFTYLHAYTDQFQSTPTFIHPQLLADSNTLFEFGCLFLEHWHKRNA